MDNNTKPIPFAPANTEVAKDTIRELRHELMKLAVLFNQVSYGMKSELDARTHGAIERGEKTLDDLRRELFDLQ